MTAPRSGAAPSRTRLAASLLANGGQSRDQRKRAAISDRLSGQGALIFGTLTLLALVCFAVIGPLLWARSPLATHPDHVLRPPSWSDPFGTDAFGRDVLARVMRAAQLDLTIPAVVVGLAAPIGTLIGSLAGFFGGLTEQLLMRATDIVLSFPGFLLALVIVAVFGNGAAVVVASLAVAYTPYFIRLTRSRVLAERSLEYVDAATVTGNRRWRVALVHVMPNSLAPSYAQVSLSFGWAILDTAGLAFLGVGIVPPTPEWGLMVGQGSHDILTGVWWTSLFPGIFILLATVAATCIGLGMRERSK